MVSRFPDGELRELGEKALWGMRALAEERSFVRRISTPVAAFIRRNFPERHIIFKDPQRVLCLKVKTSHQLIVTGAIAGCLAWALVATGTTLYGATILASKDKEIAVRAAEIDDMKINYQAAFGKLDEFQSVFSGITCEITDIQDSLLRITEKSVTTRAKASMPHLDPDANKCRSGGSGDESSTVRLTSNSGAAEGSRIVGKLPERPDQASTEHDTLVRRVAQLNDSLEKLRATHGDFLRVTDHAGHAGWISKAEVTPIVPS